MMYNRSCLHPHVHDAGQADMHLEAALSQRLSRLI